MKCKQTKDNGEKCNANAMINSEYCFLHNPEIGMELKRHYQKTGGENRAVTLKEPLQPIELKEPKDTVTLLTDTIGRVRAGQMDIRVANCLGILSQNLLKAFEEADKYSLVGWADSLIYTEPTRESKNSQPNGRET